MGSDKKKPEDWKTQDFYEKLMDTEGVTGKAHFQQSPSEEFKVQIRPDTSVSPAMFVPDPLMPGHYKAHPQTIRAMRKDIFVGGAEMFEDLEVLHTCSSCHKEIDLQFWKICPYCEAKIKTNS